MEEAPSWRVVAQWDQRTAGSAQDREDGAVRDEASFDAFVAARTGALLRSAYLLTGDQQLAEDLVQSALAKACTRWSRLVLTGDPEPYVRTVLYREHVSWWRRRRVAEILAADPPEPRRSATTDFADDMAQAQTLRAALLQLPPRQRAVIVLRHFEDRSEGDVAALLGCSVGTVRSQNARGLARLRRVVPALMDAEEAPR